MYKPFAVAAATLAVSLVGSASAVAFDPTNSSGTHGCALQDVAGHSQNVYPNSGTSQIGGSSCTYLQVDTNDDPVGGAHGGSYGAAAQSWSISACTPGKDASGNPICTPDVSFSSAQGSSPQGRNVIPVGDEVTVTVSNGSIISGTANGVAGA
jgi:hypothetical protein